MAVNLVKGGRIDLQKAVPNLKKVRIGISWNENKFNTGGSYDIDVSAFGLVHNAAGEAKLKSEEYFVFYNQLATPAKEIVHSGDNRTGTGSGDDETIIIDVEKAMAILDEISFVITIHDAIAKKQNFGQIQNSNVNVYNDEDGSIIATYNLEESFSNETALQLGSLYKNPEGHMAFRAVGQGFNIGLAEFVEGYGAAVAKK